MQIKHLRHKHGGKIESLTAIAHDTYKVTGQRKLCVTWFFRGKVRWNDSKPNAVLTEREISPIEICFDHDNAEAKLEADTIFAGLSKYLADNGKYDGMDWLPNEKTGKLAI